MVRNGPVSIGQTSQFRRPEVLLIVDQVSEAAMLGSCLEAYGYAVAVYDDIKIAVQDAEAVAPRVVLVDRQSATERFDLCRSMRDAAGAAIIVAGDGAEADVVLSLETFADQYVTRPIDPLEARARVGVALRRWSDFTSPDTVIRSGLVTIEPTSWRSWLASRELGLQRQDFLLLKFLMANVGRTVTPKQIEMAIWGVESDRAGARAERAVRRLRRRIENDPTRPERLVKVRQIGYRFDGAGIGGRLGPRTHQRATALEGLHGSWPSGDVSAGGEVRAKVLLLIDEACEVELLKGALEREAFACRFLQSASDFVAAFDRFRPDLVVMETSGPTVAAIDVCRDIRRVSETPVIIVSSAHNESSAAEMLEAGADDYLTKPYERAELVARIRATLRRVPGREAGRAAVEMLGVGDVQLDRSRREVVVRGNAIALRRREFDLLELLMGNAGEDISYERIASEVWGTDYPAGDTRTVTLHVMRLRSKIEDDRTRPSHIVTVKDVGYRYEDCQAT